MREISVCVKFFHNCEIRHEVMDSELLKLILCFVLFGVISYLYPVSVICYMLQQKA